MPPKKSQNKKSKKKEDEEYIEKPIKEKGAGGMIRKM
jgi:hypothetical protein